MGHTVNTDREYHLLQQRLDRDVTGAPDSPIFMEILKLLFLADEAEIVRHIPTTFTSLNVLSRKLKIPRDKLNEKMTEMARKGLVMDIEYNKERYFRFSPVVIGFFEFTFMRTRDELPMAELARLFEEYINEDDRFVHSIFQGEAQIGRTLVHEEALPEEDHTEILDWERTSQIVQSATAIGVSLCMCRHKASLLGEACDTPLENCLTFGYAAEMLIRNGIARAITADEAMDLIKECK